MMNIAVALNRKVIPATGVLLKSILANNTQCKLQIYMLHNELTAEDCRYFRELFTVDTNMDIIFVKIARERFENLPENQNWTIETYFRLLMMEQLPETVERILYLDVDMIVNKDLTKFYETDFEGKLLIVSKDMAYDRLIREDTDENRAHNEMFRELQKDGMVYFCAGMLLMNLAELRKEYTFERYLEVFMSHKEKMIFFDQDLLNFVHYKQVKFVDEYKYGVFAYTAHSRGISYEEIKEKAYIIHFAGATKPWTTNLLRYDIEKIWWEYAKMCPFYQDILEQVFYQSMESTFTEKTIHDLMEENKNLHDIIGKYENILKRIVGKENE